MKKKGILISLLVLFLVGLIILGMYFVDRAQMKNNKAVIFSTWGYKYEQPVIIKENSQEEINKNAVVIKNNQIQNEYLIDEFIEKTDFSKIESQELNIIQDDKRVKIIYTPGEYARIYNENGNGETLILPVDDGSAESMQKIYGYYSLIVNDEEPLKFALLDHHIARLIEGNNVILYFEAPLIDYVEIQNICSYSLESSDYKQKFYLVYNQRKDLGIKEIFDTGEYKIKTFGGDVIIVMGDLGYSLIDALNSKIITPEDILSQAKLDAKYGICIEGMYSDGESQEYCYYGDEENQYTILKLNTLYGEKDLIIGMGGQILSLYNKNK